MGQPAAPEIFGRYALFDLLATGGMAGVHLARLLGPAGFRRTVAIKRLHPGHAQDPDLVAMLIDEARLVARIRHPNVVQTIDVVAEGGEILLVMEYVHGATLSRLVPLGRQRRVAVPTPILVSIVSGALRGLHAAHQATSDQGAPLDLVHRDISPQNILVGVDGIARVLDFGVAKAKGRSLSTHDGQIKGKLRYLAPEQASGTATPRTDIYAAGVVLWEALTGRRPFEGDDEREILAKILHAPVNPPSHHVPYLEPGIDAAIVRALSRDPAERFATAEEMAATLERHVMPATANEVSAWVLSIAGEELAARAELIRRIEGWSADETRQEVSGTRLGVDERTLDDLDVRRRAGKPVVEVGTRQDPAATHFRSTLLVASLNSLRNNGWFDRYLAALPASRHGEMLGLVAGAWVPVDVVMDHYSAIERAGFSPAEMAGHLRTANDTLKGYLWETSARMSRIAGVPLWTTLRRYGFFWHRLVRGGSSVQIWELGPKEAGIEVFGVGPLAIPFFRAAFLHFHEAGARLFTTQAYAKELNRHATPTSIAMRLSWV